ncbi:hypothetical protein, partial [Thiolapillus sp.]|uniref:hypothetical protein n=1 Tax=Thiolapillus sp. TaxID=2017437 RepID=UPI003AF6FA0E
MTRTAGAQIGCQRLSRFWGLGCPKIYHEAEDTLVNGFAGSIFFLDPGQRYELAVEISDPDGGNTRQTLSISTR